MFFFIEFPSASYVAVIGADMIVASCTERGGNYETIAAIGSFYGMTW